MISPAALFINVLLTAAALLAVFARFVILAILLWAGNGHVVQDDLTACVIALVFVLSWFFAWYPDWLRREIAARAFPGRYARRGLRIAWLNAYLLLLAASYLGLSMISMLASGSPSTLAWKDGVVSSALCCVGFLVGLRHCRYPSIHILNGLALASRDQVFELLNVLIVGMSADRTIQVTSFERYYKDYVEESAACERWMRGWQQAVVSRQTPVEQLIRIYNEDNLAQDLESRLKTYENCSEYDIRIIIAPPSIPMVDLYMEIERFAVIALPKDSRTNAFAEQFLLVTEDLQLRALAVWFKTMWDNGRPIKDHSGATNGLAEAKAVLADLARCDPKLLEFSPQLVITGAKVIPDAIKLLIEVSKFDGLAVLMSEWGRTLRSKLQEALHHVRHIPVGSYQEFTSISDALLSAFLEAQGTVRCTSMIREGDDFWMTQEQAIERLEQIRIQRGIRVHRIFVFPNPDLRRHYLPLMKSQADAGTSVSYVISASAVRDFAVIDDRFIVIDTPHAAMRTDVEADVQGCIRDFNTLLSEATAVTGEHTC